MAPQTDVTMLCRHCKRNYSYRKDNKPSQADYIEEQSSWWLQGQKSCKTGIEKPGQMSI